jgi:hypothetical protein
VTGAAASKALALPARQGDPSHAYPASRRRLAVFGRWRPTKAALWIGVEGRPRV